MEEISKFEIEEIVKGIPGGFFIYYAGGDEEIIYANREVIYLFGCENIEEFRKYTQNSFRGMVHHKDFGPFVKNDIYGEVFNVFITDISDKMKESLKQKKEMINIAADRELLQKVLACTIYSYIQLYMIHPKDNYYRMIYPNPHDEQACGDFKEAIERNITTDRVVSKEVLE